MTTSRRNFLHFTALLLAGSAATRAHALNPQPEVPSKQHKTERGSPRALNPQPEVPSKQGPSHQTPHALNPQPEVPSKPKKKKQERKTQSKPQTK